MWPFDSKRTRSGSSSRETPPGATPSADRFSKLESDLEKLTHTVRGLEVEWMEWFDKYRRLYARIAKRQERDEVQETAETTRQDPPGRTIGIAEVSRHGGPRARGNY